MVLMHVYALDSLKCRGRLDGKALTRLSFNHNPIVLILS
jgi:hypothetical protein